MRGITLTGTDLNYILDYLGDLDFRGRIDEGPLFGYDLKISKHGSHHTDGCMVDYTLKFTSPNGTNTTLNTLVCLAVGWNFSADEEVIIK
jgi:hypothetical protein